jgi:acyl-coenzyme A synthetase/AMP-(fatty) acid ligase
VQAAVQLRPDMQTTGEELIAFVRDRLGPVQTPKHIHFFETLPRSPVGKVLKTAVRDQALSKLSPPN